MHFILLILFFIVIQSWEGEQSENLRVTWKNV